MNPDDLIATAWHNVLVSIPYQRESTGEVPMSYVMIVTLMNSFNSLPTGKHRGTRRSAYLLTFDIKFQFPTNGKAQGNYNSIGEFLEVVFVSIPYQRESTCEQKP